MIKITTNFILTIACLFLAGCVSQQPTVIPIHLGNHFNETPKNITTNYMPNIHVISNDIALLDAIDQQKNKRFFVKEKNHSTLFLQLESSLKPNNLTNQPVRLVGIIKKKNRNYNYHVNYKLVDSTDSIIDSNQIIGISDEPISSISNQINANQEALNDAATQIVEKINMNINNILIDFKVISISKSSVFVAVNSGIRFTQDDVFLVNELPGTALVLQEVISSQDKHIAELKVVAGTFPNVGMTVSLQK